MLTDKKNDVEENETQTTFERILAIQEENRISKIKITELQLQINNLQLQIDNDKLQHKINVAQLESQMENNELQHKATIEQMELEMEAMGLLPEGRHATIFDYLHVIFL